MAPKPATNGTMSRASMKVKTGFSPRITAWASFFAVLLASNSSSSLSCCTTSRPTPLALALRRVALRPFRLSLCSARSFSLCSCTRFSRSFIGSLENSGASTVNTAAMAATPARAAIQN